MKTLRLLCALFGLMLVGSLKAAAAPAPKTEVIFDHPEKFTDVRDSYVATEKGRDAILDTLRSYLVRNTEHLIPDGDKLTITFTDIDLAGEYEPWRGAQYDDVRIVKDIYPPAFKFTYSVTDPSGKVIRQGSENIRDMNFQMRLTIDPSDPLRFEKDILGEWARSKLAGLPRN